jgi:hypothetical protein
MEGQENTAAPVDTNIVAQPQGQQIPVQQPVVQAQAPQVPVGQINFDTPTPVKQEPEPVVETPKVQLSTDPSSYTGNSALDTAINIFAATSGFDKQLFDDSIGHALHYKDPNLIDYNTLTKGLKPEQAAQAKALVQQVYNEQVQAVEQGIKQVYELAGSKENWDLALNTFQQTAPTWAKQAAKALQAQGNSPSDVQALAEFILNSVQGLGVVPQQQGNLVQPSTSYATNGLSKAEFGAALNKLQAEHGAEILSPHSKHFHLYEQLAQARELGRQLGK